MQITIARAAPEDAAGTHEVFYRAWLATYPNREYSITIEDVEYRFRNRNSEELLFKRRMEYALRGTGQVVLVAKDEQLVVGVCRLFNTAKKNQLQALYILPKYQTQGIGTALWKEAQKYLDPSRDVEIWTAVYNTRAIAVYKKWGFRETGQRDLDPRLTMANGAIIPEIQLILSR